MATGNASVSDVLATTIESRSRKIADNVTDNNILLKKLSLKGKIKPFSGGHKIYQEVSYAENGNSGWYSGYDILPTAASDVITAAEFDIKQAAVPVVISGLEMLQNAGKERMIDLLDSRLQVAESTLANLISVGLYSDGTSGKIDGLDTAVPVDPTSGTYGGIVRAGAANDWWKSQLQDAEATAALITTQLNTLWAKCVRGSDTPDLIIMDNNIWGFYMSALQDQQRFSTPEMGDLGFATVKFLNADVGLDGGIGGNATTSHAYMLNCDYLHYRPHSQRNMVPLSPNKRYATNQDAEVQILAWAGNLTCSGAQFQGRLTGEA